MDRRDALKKMMAGGAVVAGASMVSSSPVFAAGSVGGGQPTGPGLTTPPPTGQTVNDKRTATWTISVPDVSCSSGPIAGRVVDAHPHVDRRSECAWWRHRSDSATSRATPPPSRAIRTGPGNSPFRRGDAFEVIWYGEVLVHGERPAAGCQLVNYTYRYVNQSERQQP